MVSQLYARFLKHFSTGSLFRRLTHFNHSAGKFDVRRKGLARLSDQYRVTLAYDGNDNCAVRVDSVGHKDLLNMIDDLKLIIA